MKTRRRQNRKRVGRKTKRGGMSYSMQNEQIGKDFIMLSDEKDIFLFVKKCEDFFKNKSFMYMNRAGRIWNSLVNNPRSKSFFTKSQQAYFTNKFKIVNRIQFKKHDAEDYDYEEDLSRKPEYAQLEGIERLDEFNNNIQAAPAAGGKRKKNRKTKKNRKH
jgi:hypothetical protein